MYNDGNFDAQFDNQNNNFFGWTSPEEEYTFDDINITIDMAGNVQVEYPY